MRRKLALLALREREKGANRDEDKHSRKTENTAKRGWLPSKSLVAMVAMRRYVRAIATGKTTVPTLPKRSMNTMNCMLKQQRVAQRLRQVRVP
jgi:hypothetical protein